MTKGKSIAEIRREYGQLSLNEQDLPTSPFEQFDKWIADVVKAEQSDPTAMVLSTVDAQGIPDSRVVLLKEVRENAFVFFTNYQSAKAQQIKFNQNVALNFYWPELARQVRIRGKAQLLKAKDSDEYFISRPIFSQYSSLVSPQSKIIKSRTELEHQLADLITKHANKSVSRPKYWGGYEVLPFVFEFWQGRDNRLHDRIQYYLQKKQWKYQRLAP